MKVTLTDLQAMKRDGTKIVGVVAWDYQMARIVDRVGADIVWIRGGPTGSSFLRR